MKVITTQKINMELSIKPGIGLGKILFGMDKTEVEFLLGAPISDQGPNFIHWIDYAQPDLSLGFSEQHGWRLISIICRDPNVEFFDETIIGLTFREFSELCVKNGLKFDIKHEKDEEDFEVDVKKLDVTLSFDIIKNEKHHIGGISLMPHYIDDDPDFSSYC